MSPAEWGRLLGTIVGNMIGSFLVGALAYQWGYRAGRKHEAANYDPERAAHLAAQRFLASHTLFFDSEAARGKAIAAVIASTSLLHCFNCGAWCLPDNECHVCKQPLPGVIPRSPAEESE